jgi:hypothetical protein
MMTDEDFWAAHAGRVTWTTPEEHQMGERSYVLVSIQRDDGYNLVTCPDLPGFSYILEPGAGPDALLPTLEAFVAVNSEWLASQQRN